MNKNEKRITTQVDIGWREKHSGRIPTQIDADWRKNADHEMDPMMMADAGAFGTIEAFAEEVKNVKEIVSARHTTYQVEEVLRQGGEAVLLKCKDSDKNEVVAKVYFKPVDSQGSSIEARRRVLEYMQIDEGKEYTLPVTDQGIVKLRDSKFYFEITKYCPEGDISKWENITFQEIVEVIDRMNEAMHSFHQAGILHRDIKPENLFLVDGKLVFSDFGLAKIINGKATNVTVGSEGYRAPEILVTASTGESAYFFDEKSEYYALGVTIGSLFEGEFVYKGMTGAMITMCMRNSALPLRRVADGRRELENLLYGLCQYDPNRRFGYEDVKKWLKDHQYRGNCDSEEWPRAFRMLGEEFRDEQSLFLGITQDKAHWKEGTELLYSKYFENFFKAFRTDIAREAQRCEEAYRSDDRDKGLAIFLKKLYPAGSLVWRGYSFQNLQMLAEKMAVTKTPLGYAELLQKSIVSHWLVNTEGIEKDEDVLQMVLEMEKTAQTYPQAACYWFGNSFSRQKYLKICSKEVHSIPELYPALFESAYEFYYNDGYQKIMNPKEDGALYGFLYSFGLKKALDNAIQKCEGADIYQKCCTLFILLEDIALKYSVDTNGIRSFFIKYGPLGGVSYVRGLVTDTDIYIPFDHSGRKILDEIKEFRMPEKKDIAAMMIECKPFVEKVNQLQKVMIDNPFCIKAGIYDKHAGAVLCKNLKGVFGFFIHGQLMPLGFEALIRENKRGE